MQNSGYQLAELIQLGTANSQRGPAVVTNTKGVHSSMPVNTAAKEPMSFVTLCHSLAWLQLSRRALCHFSCEKATKQATPQCEF